MGAKIQKKNEISAEWLLKGIYCSECAHIHSHTFVMLPDYQTVGVPIVGTPPDNSSHGWYACIENPIPTTDD